jgi:4-cresol dehydrogenase (hydroxylating)
MLERGSGFMAHRIDDLKGMEVMLADGKLFRSGFWGEKGEKEVFHYPMGMGPEWKGLFSQSNLGIVTKAVVNLHPRLEVQKMLWCKVPENNLPELVEGLGELYQRKYLVAVTHIGNDKRMKIEHRGSDSQSTWTSFGMIQGSDSFIRFLEEEIPALIGHRCLSLGFFTREEAEDAGIGAVFGCNTGIPTDYFLKAMYQSEDLNPDEHDLQIDFGPLGMLCCLPVLPLEASAISACLEILNSIYRDFGIQPATTLNPMNDLCLESVINIYFDRNRPEEVEKAHQANLEMSRRFYEAGFRFYRLDVRLMKEFIRSENSHWDLVNRLKVCLDPEKILSPGRYSLGR